MTRGSIVVLSSGGTDAAREAALRLFLERGLDGVTIDDITQACGVAKGTFYRYFDDKAALVESLLAPVRAELVEALELCGRALGAGLLSLEPS